MANDAAGKIKQGVGKTGGSDRTRAAQEVKGDAQQVRATPRMLSRMASTKLPTRRNKSSDCIWGKIGSKLAFDMHAVDDVFR